jgi:uncharacterized protein
LSHADQLTHLGEEKFVQLTTFRRDGTPVPTPVWVATGPDGSLVVTTPTGSGKVKRLRHTPEVELRPCSRRGAVPDGAPVVAAFAVVDASEETVTSTHRTMGAKYGLEFRLVMGVERLLRRGPVDRVVLRITTAR